MAEASAIVVSNKQMRIIYFSGVKFVLFFLSDG